MHPSSARLTLFLGSSARRLRTPANPPAMPAEFDDVLTNQPVVLDAGSGSIKAGFAGKDVPSCLFPN